MFSPDHASCDIPLFDFPEPPSCAQTMALLFPQMTKSPSTPLRPGQLPTSIAQLALMR